MINPLKPAGDLPAAVRFWHYTAQLRSAGRVASAAWVGALDNVRLGAAGARAGRGRTEPRPGDAGQALSAWAGVLAVNTPGIIESTPQTLKLEMSMHNNNRQRRGRRPALAIAMLSLVFSSLAIANDYPTETRVDYVLGCMASNGQGYLVMQKCSCSIDTIAELVPFDEYEAVETIVRMHNKRGELGVLFRTSKSLEEQVQRFRAAQAEASLRCF